MRRSKMTIQIVGLTVVMFLITVDAFGHCGSCRSSAPPVHVTSVKYTPAITVVTIQRITTPAYFFKQWLAKDAAESFRNNKLKINTASAAKDEHAKAKECMKIYVTSKEKNLEGCILTFEKREDLEAEQKHYLALNEKGELHNWSFVKDNILLVLDGSVSEEEARLYEASLDSLKEDK